MIIAADKNQFSGTHGRSNSFKHKQIEGMGHTLMPCPLPFGDYCLVTQQMQETIDRRGENLKKQDLVADIRLSIDTKKDLLEVCGNICSGSHNRFRDEVIMAQKMGARLIVLVEEAGIKDVKDVFRWVNPRLKRYNQIKYMHGQGRWQTTALPKRPPTDGKTLAKAMITMQEKYGVEWLFCRPQDTGKEVVQLLVEGNNEKI